MIILESLTLTALIVIAGLHFIWAMRVWWPIPHEKQLARTVAGFSGIDKMPPPAACFFVAVAVSIVAMMLFIEVFQIVPNNLVTIALLASGLVFLGRGLIGFTPIWARLTPEQPFRRLDLRYYSPLCVAIGAMIEVVVLT